MATRIAEILQFNKCSINSLKCQHQSNSYFEIDIYLIVK